MACPSMEKRHLILLHGLASSPAEFSLIVGGLRRRGINVLTPVIDGYSSGSCTAARSHRDWIESASAAVESLAESLAAPFVLGGLCSGAMLSLAVATQRAQPRLQGLALLSPLFAYDGWGLPGWYRLRYLAYALGLADRFSMHERPPFGLKNERMRQFVHAQLASGLATLSGPPSVSLAAVRESERLSRLARARLQRLSVPVLAIHARQDEICSVASVRRALEGVPQELLQFLVLDDSYHMITADNDRDLVARTLADFAVACMPARTIADRNLQGPTTSVV